MPPPAIASKSLASFATPEELSDNLRDQHSIEMSPDRLRELAELGYIPSVHVDGRGPVFRKAEAKEWIRNNLVVGREPRPFPAILSVVSPALRPETAGPVPDELVLVSSHLRELPLTHFFRGACVYFLVKSGRVVYVGQTDCVVQRVASHMAGKDFDRALYLFVPKEQLDDLEAAFIRALRPKLNGSHNRPASERDHELIARHWPTLADEAAPPLSTPGA